MGERRDIERVDDEAPVWLRAGAYALVSTLVALLILSAL